MTEISRRRHGSYADPSESRRQATFSYTVPDGKGRHLQICRKMFSDIFGVSHHKVQGLAERKKAGHNVFVDSRGKSNRARKFTEDIVQQVIAHINEFPREENHYSREKSKKECLSPDLNINRLFVAFQKRYPEVSVNYRFYADVFKKHFPNLRFGRPRSDTCSTCDLLSNKMKADPADHTLSAKLNLHHRKAESARKNMQEDSIDSQQPNSNTLVLSMDLEQIISIPTLTHSEMYYSRQLSCYNFDIHCADNNKATMFLWDESLTGRGGNEIGSALLKFLLSDNLTVKENICIWSDNCNGQNKNRMVLIAMIYLVASGKFAQIDQKFLVSGHTFLPCDRDFAQIERRKRLTKLYVPQNIEKMIKECCHKNPYSVVRMEENDFKDLHSLANEYINISKLNISQASWVRVTKDNPFTVFIRKSFNDMAPWEKCNVLKKGKELINFRSEVIPLLECKNRITKAKIDNLKSMLDYIPLAYLGFYDDLIARTSEQGAAQENVNQGGT